MASPLPEKYYVVLEQNTNGGRLMVDLEAFALFDLWIDQELSLLEEKFADFVRPWRPEKGPRRGLIES